MTKEQFINKWWPACTTTFIDDIDTVIATEIAKVQEAKPEEPNGNCSTFDGSRLVDQVQPTLNPIERAYERGEKIRQKIWYKRAFIEKYKYDDLLTIDENSVLMSPNKFNFKTHPDLWELYTEPTEQPAQPSSQVKLDNSFDKERFEAMFRAVVANGGHELDHKEAIELTEESLAKLDAYYASKKGGNNG